MIKLLVALLVATASTQAQDRPSPLVEALRSELALVQTTPDRYYLVVDLQREIVSLRAGGRDLMSAQIVSKSSGGWKPGARTLDLTERCPPHLPVTAQTGRLASRRLALDFVGRLIDGPTGYDRLVFESEFVLSSPRAPLRSATQHVLVSRPDLKSLSSAAGDSIVAILIPPSTPQ